MFIIYFKQQIVGVINSFRMANLLYLRRFYILKPLYFHGTLLTAMKGLESINQILIKFTSSIFTTFNAYLTILCNFMHWSLGRFLLSLQKKIYYRKRWTLLWTCRFVWARYLLMILFEEMRINWGNRDLCEYFDYWETRYTIPVPYLVEYRTTISNERSNYRNSVNEGELCSMYGKMKTIGGHRCIYKTLNL